MCFLRNSDVIMMPVLPFLLYFAAKIVKSSIQTAQKWPIPRFNVFWVRTKRICSNLTSIWRHYDVIFTILSSKIIKSSIKIVYKWLIPLFNVFWARKKEYILVIFSNLPSLWRHYDVIFTIFSSEIIKSSIQIVWKWLIALF